MSFETGLMRLLHGSTCIVGMGSYFRSDDAAGLVLVDQLSENLKGTGTEIVNVEDVLENYVFFIDGIACDNVLIIDAVNAGIEEGALVFGRVSELKEITMGISSHKMALEAACRIFELSGKTVWLLGISVHRIDYGRGLSPAIQEVVGNLSALMTNIIKEAKIENYERQN